MNWGSNWFLGQMKVFALGNTELCYKFRFDLLCLECPINLFLLIKLHKNCVSSMGLAKR